MAREKARGWTWGSETYRNSKHAEERLTRTIAGLLCDYLCDWDAGAVTGPDETVYNIEVVVRLVPQ